MQKSLFVGLLLCYAFAGTIECETGEVCHFQDTQPVNIVRTLKDGPIVYMQDKEGTLYSFSADEKNVLTRTTIFRLPILGTIYNLFFSNTLTLSRNPCELVPWAISHTTYETSDCTTISLFEMVNAYPIEIRNRGPWFFPGSNYVHKGPQGMVGVDLTALDKWIVISGYTPDRQKIFAYRKLNHDLAGHNFLRQYQLSGSKTVTWEPNALLKRFARWIGVSQTVVQLPLPDWQIITLPENAEPSLLLKRQASLGGKIILTIPLDQGRQFTYFDIENGEYLPAFETNSSFRPCPWHTPEVQRFILSIQTKFTNKATLDGVQGQIQLLSQEPLYGTFTSHDGIRTDIYAMFRNPLNFLCNQLQFFNDKGLSLDLRISEP